MRLVYLGGVGMTSSVMGSCTRVLHGCSSPRLGGDSITNDTSPLAIPCGRLSECHLYHKVSHTILLWQGTFCLIRDGAVRQKAANNDLQCKVSQGKHALACWAETGPT